MIYQSKENPNSHVTVKDRNYPSLPVKILLERKLIQGEILDFGCGLGKDVEFLRSKGFAVIGYDPHYFPKYPQTKFDTIICFYVLNVLFPDEQAFVIMAVSELLKNSGKAYFAVRRDIKRNGFLFNPKRNAKTYQCNVVLPFKSIFQNENTEIYEYRHFTRINIGRKNVSPFFEGVLLLEATTSIYFSGTSTIKFDGIIDISFGGIETFSLAIMSNPTEPFVS